MIAWLSQGAAVAHILHSPKGGAFFGLLVFEELVLRREFVAVGICEANGVVFLAVGVFVALAGVFAF